MFGAYILSYHSNLNHLCDHLGFKIISFASLLCQIYQRLLLWEVKNSNPFSRTYVQFTIVIFTWYILTSYYIVLPMSISARVYQPGGTCFRYSLFLLLVKYHIMYWHNWIIVLCTLWPCSFDDIIWIFSSTTNYYMAIMCTWILILSIFIWHRII